VRVVRSGCCAVTDGAVIDTSELTGSDRSLD
jgi:hypothetical protein